ncbi:MAG TPA: outer membrane lipoprotein carrier protein LolA [Myxococcaceae bacterium]|nr:outer membrane lipoprotein carrier protein LolA [Myxococcaceae bacterium]
MTRTIVFAFVRTCALALVVAQGTAAAAAEPMPRELSALRESLAKTRKVSARFKQSRHWAALKDTLVSGGTLRYEKGGPLVWHTDPPAESELILKGETAILSQPALGTRETLDLSADPGMARVFDSIGAVLQANFEVLEPLFAVSVVRASAPLTVALRPRAPELARVVKGIRLEFDRRLHLARVTLDEASGDRTEITFFDHVVEAAGR